MQSFTFVHWLAIVTVSFLTAVGFFTCFIFAIKKCSDVARRRPCSLCGRRFF